MLCFGSAGAFPLTAAGGFVLPQHEPLVLNALQLVLVYLLSVEALDLKQQFASSIIFKHCGSVCAGHPKRVKMSCTYPLAQVVREDGFLSLLKEEDHHQRKRVGGNPALRLAVYVAKLKEKYWA